MKYEGNAYSTACFLTSEKILLNIYWSVGFGSAGFLIGPKSARIPQSQVNFHMRNFLPQNQKSDCGAFNYFDNKKNVPLKLLNQLPQNNVSLAD